jgi:hypothetical protein
MFIDSPMMVMRFGAIHEGTLLTSHSQYPCMKGSSRERPALWYLCSSSRFSWCLDSGGVGNWNNLFNTHPVVVICPKPIGDSGWGSPHRFLADRCPLMDLGLVFGDSNLFYFVTNFLCLFIWKKKRYICQPLLMSVSLNLKKINLI